MSVLAGLCFFLAAFALVLLINDAYRRRCSVCFRSWAVFTAGRDDDRCRRHRVRRSS